MQAASISCIVHNAVFSDVWCGTPTASHQKTFSGSSKIGVLWISLQKRSADLQDALKKSIHEMLINMPNWNPYWKPSCQAHHVIKAVIPKSTSDHDPQVPHVCHESHGMRCVQVRILQTRMRCAQVRILQRIPHTGMRCVRVCILQRINKDIKTIGPRTQRQ